MTPRKAKPTVDELVGLTIDKRHRYFWNGVGPIPSVTTILQLQDVLIGGSLSVWGALQAVERILDGRPWAGATDEDLRKAALERVTHLQKVGSVVHEHVAKLVGGSSPEPTMATAPFIYSWARFMADKRPRFVHVEQRVLNEKHGYAGTLDFMAEIDGELALVDVKTGRYRNSHLLQLVGYAAAEGIGIEGLATLEPLPKPKRYALLLLRADGYEYVPMKPTLADRRHFFELVKAYRRIREWDVAHQEKRKL